MATIRAETSHWDGGAGCGGPSGGTAGTGPGRTQLGTRQENGRIPLAKSPGCLAAHTSAGNLVGAITGNQTRTVK